MSEEKIIELLTKKRLTGEEKKQLSEVLSQNAGLKELVKIINSLGSLSGKEHIDISVLSEYVLYLNGDVLPGSKVIPVIPEIEDHLKKCERCREKFELLNSELNGIDGYLNEKIIPAEIPQSTSIEKKDAFYPFVKIRPSYIYAAAAFVVLLVSLVGISNFTTPDYVNISTQSKTEDFSSTRGRNTIHFNNAILAFENNDYNRAIDELKNDTEANAGDPTIFYTYYILGKTHLTKAYSDYFGLFPSYDKNELSYAVDNFQKVLELNKSELFRNVNLNTYYFLGKSYLLKGDFDKANEYLRKAVDEKCEYSKEAETLLTSIK